MVSIIRWVSLNPAHGRPRETTEVCVLRIAANHGLGWSALSRGWQLAEQRQETIQQPVVRRLVSTVIHSLGTCTLALDRRRPLSAQQHHRAVGYNLGFGPATRVRTAMQLRWPAFVLSLSALLPSRASDVRRKYELETAPEFLFERKPFRSECADRTPTRNGITERGAQAV